MAIQIDRLETTVELTTTSTDAGAGAGVPPPKAAPERGNAELCEMLGRVMSDELELFMRSRGLA
jgi:hypothetical protein